MRKKTNRRIDAEIYKRTASGTKTLNLGFKHFRGGTRL